MDEDERGGRAADARHDEIHELRRLWHAHIGELAAVRRRRHHGGRALGVLVAAALVVGALFVDDQLAWDALGAARSWLSQVFEHVADDLADAFWVERQ